MGQFVKETAHKQYIGNKKYQDNYDSIDWGTHGKKESNQEDCQEGSEETNNQKEDDNARK